jgi:23S rRNA (adenine2503-C2)-methyltransferase
VTSLIASTVDATQQEPEKVNLLGLPLAAMEQYFLELGEKKFRAQQVLKWIHHHGVTDIDEMSNLGKVLREKLKSVAEIKPPEIVSQHDSNDGTRKWAIRVLTS